MNLQRSFKMSVLAANLAKANLRKEIKQRIASISLDERKRQSTLLKNKLMENSHYKNSKRICLYLSMDDEVSTTEILKDAFSSGKQCFIPRYTKTEMEMLSLSSYEDYLQLPMTKWNIKQPENNKNRDEALSSGGLDLILVPGLAFTKDGHRLGRGKGYYDVYLKKCSQKSNPPISIALAFEQQIIENIPINEYDFPVDYVLYTSSI